MKKRIVSAILLSALLLSCFSCSNSDESKGSETTAAPTVTDPVETEEPRIYPDLPEITFDGSDFRFYSYTNGSYFEEIYAEEETGEPINDALYRINTLIEEKYDINISYTEDGYLTVMENVKRYVNASEDVYEVVIPMGHMIAGMYTSNVFYNLYAIEHLDFEKPWWDQNSIETFSLAGYMPFAVSDMVLNSKSVAATVLFNKKLADDYQVGNLYDEVYNNTWTMETMHTKAKMVSEDLNGDGIYDDNDRYGIVTTDRAVIPLLHSAGGRIVTKDADGYPQLAFQSEYNFTAIKDFLETLMYEEQVTRNNDFVANGKGANDMFADDQALFLMLNLMSTQHMREMESDFGILPMPKYQASQKNYVSSVSCAQGSLITVPITTQKTEMIGVIVEAMSAESMYTLVPALYDTVFKDKTTRDEESVAMLDIIINNMVYDVGEYYDLGGFSDRFVRITGSVYENNVDPSYPKQTSDLASFYAKYEKVLEKALEKLIKTIDEWNAME